MRCVLVSCCGLPAAGKTTFCRSVANCTASDATTTTTTARSTTVDASFNNDSHMATTKEALLLASMGAMATASTSSAKLFNRLRDESVFRVRHVCFDEHIDQARRRRRPPSLSSQNFSSKPRSHQSREGEAHEEPQRHIEEGHGDRDDNASTRNGAESDDTDTSAAAIETDAMQHSGWAEGEGGTARWWHAGRRDAMAEVEALLAASRSRVVSSPSPPTPAAAAVIASAGGGGTGLEEAVTDVVIADDNMHFRSMRHEVLCLARKYGCGYAQVYFPAGVEVAVERNRGRAVPVAEAVIRKMAKSIQPPDPERFKWERHTSIIERSGLGQNVGGAWKGGNGAGADVLGRHRASSSSSCAGTESGEDASAMLSFWRVITAAAEDPVPALPVLATTASREQESDRAATKASFLHQLDLELRESVKRVAGKAAQGNITRENIRAVMGACSVSRRVSLRRAKGGYWTQRGDVASGEDTADDLTKSACCVEGSSRSSTCAPGQEGSIKVAQLSSSPMQEFCVEFEKTLSGFFWLEPSVRRELVEAARGVACTKL